jgi:hypothetical protein
MSVFTQPYVVLTEKQLQVENGRQLMTTVVEWMAADDNSSVILPMNQKGMLKCL